MNELNLNSLPKLSDTLLLQRVAAARRQLHPVSLVLVRIDGVEDFSPSDREHALGALGAVLRKTLREADGAFRADDYTVAALLENTSESGAVWATERLRGLLHSSPASEGITVSMPLLPGVSAPGSTTNAS